MNDSTAAVGNTQPQTRTDRRRAATHSELLDVVRTLTIEHTGPGFTVTDVAERADVAVGTFYNHFRDRDEAIVSAFNRDLDKHSEIAANLAFESMDAVDRFSSNCGLLTRRLLEHPNWDRFALGAHAIRMSGTVAGPGPSYTFVLDGVHEGSMKTEQPLLGYLMTRHLVLAIAELGPTEVHPDLEQTVASLLGACALILGFDPCRVPTLTEWIVSATDQVVWN